MSLLLLQTGLVGDLYIGCVQFDAHIRTPVAGAVQKTSHPAPAAADLGGDNFGQMGTARHDTYPTFYLSQVPGFGTAGAMTDHKTRDGYSSGRRAQLRRFEQPAGQNQLVVR
jgi:hypothetical protein